MNELTSTNKHFREEYILCSIRYIKKLKEFCSENNDTINSIYELFADNIEFFSTFIDKSIVSTSLRELEKNLIMKNIKKETKKETKINPSHIKNAIECLFLFELLEKDKDEINITENDLNDDDKIHEVIQKLLCFKNEDILLKLTQAMLVFYFGQNASNGNPDKLSTPKTIDDVLFCFNSARKTLDKQGWDKKLFSSAIISLLYSDFLLYGVCDLFDDNIFKNHHAFSSIKNEKFLKDYFCLDDEKEKNGIIIPTIEEMLNVIITAIRNDSHIRFRYDACTSNKIPVDVINSKNKSSTMEKDFKTAVCGGCGKYFDKICPDEAALKYLVDKYIKEGEEIDRIVDILYNLAEFYRDRANKNEEYSDTFQAIADIVDNVASQYGEYL